MAWGKNYKDVMVVKNKVSSVVVGVGSTLIVTFITMIEILVATIQAYVFTLFSSMYIGMAIEEHHH